MCPVSGYLFIGQAFTCHTSLTPFLRKSVIPIGEPAPDLVIDELNNKYIFFDFIGVPHCCCLHIHYIYSLRTAPYTATSNEGTARLFLPEA
jgi:hypothetical protein